MLDKSMVVQENNATESPIAEFGEWPSWGCSKSVLDGHGRGMRSTTVLEKSDIVS